MSIANDDLIELQSQLAFQEHTIGELNAVLVNQQKQMDMLRLEIELLKDKLSTVEDRVEHSSAPPNEKPPHY